MTDNHTGVDTSAEAVERLARHCARLSQMRGALMDDALSDAAATLRALSAENTHLRAEIAAAERKGAEGWQPMDTAPRDGTEILAAFVSEYLFQGAPTIYGPWTVRWAGNGWISSWDGCRVIEYQGDFGTEYQDPSPAPTHWLPIPLPPSTREGE